MNLNGYAEDEKISAINEWLKTVSKITSETISLSDPNDHLTQLDRENYSIVRYNNGSEKRELTSRYIPSIIYKHIDSIMQRWGLKIKSVDFDPNSHTKSIIWDGLCYVRMVVNEYHTNMFQLTGTWETYHQETIESLIDDYFIKRAEDSNDPNLVREIKIRAILK